MEHLQKEGIISSELYLVKFMHSSGLNNFYLFQTAETPPPIGRGQNLVEKAVSVRYDRRRRRSSSCRVPHSCRSNRTRSDSYCKATQPSLSELTVDEITKYAFSLFRLFVLLFQSCFLSLNSVQTN